MLTIYATDVLYVHIHITAYAGNHIKICIWKTALGVAWQDWVGR